MKKRPGDIILHKCTKNYDQIIYGSWDMVHDRCNCYFSFWATFCTFTPLKPKKSKFLKKQKKMSGNIILQMFTKNYDQMIYSSWDMVHDRCNCYFSFWAIFCPFTLLTAQKIKILKKKKNTPGDIIIHKYTKSYDQMMYGSWDMLHNWQTDRKSDI